MTRRIELSWICSSCGRENRGRDRLCANGCTNPREKGEMKMKGLGPESYDSEGNNIAPTVTDPEFVVSKGKDWFCSNCESGNGNELLFCKQCGAARYEDQEAPTTIKEPPRPKPEAPRPYAKEANDALPKVLATVVIAVLVGGLIWAFSSHDVQGSVSDLSFVNTTKIYSWVNVTKRDWKHDLTERSEVKPVNGSGESAGVSILSCSQEIYTYEKYVCGNHQECHDVFKKVDKTYSCKKTESKKCGETCKDDGDGHATCKPKMCKKEVDSTCTKKVDVFDHEACETVDDICSRPIMKPKCDYRTQEWSQTQILTETGKGHNGEEHWPEVSLEPLERAVQEGAYAITLSYGEDSVHRSLPKSEYDQWQVGDQATLKVSNMGTVLSYQKTP